MRPSGKREAPRLPGAPKLHRIGLKTSHKISSRCSKVIRADCGNAFSKIAPSWISRRVRALRSLTRSLASASSNRCFACNNFFSFSVIKFFLPIMAQTQKSGSRDRSHKPPLASVIMLIFVSVPFPRCWEFPVIPARILPPSLRYCVLFAFSDLLPLCKCRSNT